MNDSQRSLKDLAEIRQMMEQSTRFLSLSGLSGISAGAIALLGAWVTHLYLRHNDLNNALLTDSQYFRVTANQLGTLIFLAVVILLCAAAAASFFTIRRSRRQGVSIWTRPARRMAINLLIPLGAGAIFCVQLAWYGFSLMVAPATLIFYGLALLNASKYTLPEIRYLGLGELALGLIAGLFPGHGILFWCIGFGALHILYGSIMYMKYER